MHTCPVNYKLPVVVAQRKRSISRTQHLQTHHVADASTNKTDQSTNQVFALRLQHDFIDSRCVSSRTQNKVASLFYNLAQQSEPPSTSLSSPFGTTWPVCRGPQFCFAFFTYFCQLLSTCWGPQFGVWDAILGRTGVVFTAQGLEKHKKQKTRNRLRFGMMMVSVAFKTRGRRVPSKN